VKPSNFFCRQIGAHGKGFDRGFGWFEGRQARGSDQIKKFSPATRLPATVIGALESTVDGWRIPVQFSGAAS